MDHPKDFVLLNRTEMQKSAFFSLAMELPPVQNGVFDLLIRKGARSRASGCGSQPRPLCHADVQGDITATSLFHVVRDLNYADWIPPSGKQLTEAPFVELDVVVQVKGKLLLAFELKWESSIGNLDKQLQKEQLALTMLAEYYNISRTVLVAVVPYDPANLEHADATLTIKEMQGIIHGHVQDAVGTGLAKRLDSEFEVMVKTTPVRRMDWKYFKLDGLLKYAKKDPEKAAFVGYNKGLQHLTGLSGEDVRKRPSWKIAERPRGTRVPDWYDLDAVRDILNKKPGLNGGSTLQC